MSKGLSEAGWVYYVQSEQVRGERRSYWIERRNLKSPSQARYTECIQDFGTNKSRAEKRCNELNAGRGALASRLKED